MFIKFRNSVFFILGILLLTSILMLPQIYFALMDSYAYEREQKMEKISFELSSEVKDIAMVNRLHQLLNSYYIENSVEDTFLVEVKQYNANIVDISSNYNIGKVQKKIKKANFLKYINVDRMKNFNFISKIETDSNVGIERYILKNKKEFIEIKWDNKMNKIIYVKYQGKQAEKIRDKDIFKMEKEYLDDMNLSLIDDWNYNNKRMVSKKAHLALTFLHDVKRKTLQLKWEIAN